MDTACGEGPRRRETAMRRGSYDDSAASLRPHLRNLAHRRLSAPSLAFGKALGMPWSPIREEASCWPTVDQCPFVLGLSSEYGELLLDQRVQLTEGNKTKDRHLFLFSDVLVFAKLKSSASYRLKYTVSLGDIWLYSFNDDDDYGDDEDAGGDVDLRVTLVLAWAPTFCIVSFGSPGLKELWLDTLHRRIIEARALSGVTTPAPHALMRVLSGNISSKTLTGVGMEPFIEFQSEDNIKLPGPGKPPSNQEDRLSQPIENSGKWNRLCKAIKVLTRSESDSGAPLFGQDLCKICPESSSLPKPVTDMLVLLWKKGPSMEGVFRKTCNFRTLKDIREQLNAGLKVDMEQLSAVLLGGLLKCFLKELPGSLLVSELYVSWVKALDADEDQQRALQIKSVLAELPVHNRLLLQQLLSVLRHIMESSDINKMDAHNLAVCIAPTLLQLDANATALEDKLKKVTELTEYLIEHSCELLGEDVFPLLGDTDEDNSDSLSSQQLDSAYDSTDPEAEVDLVEGAGSAAGSSRSLPCCAAAGATGPSCASEAFTKLAFSRRSSEPILTIPSPPVEATTRVALTCLARSHDDCSLESSGRYCEQVLKKQISDDSLSLRTLPEPAAGGTAALPNQVPLRCSTCSLESTASNQSEGSVFSGSPQESPPPCPRKWSSTRQPRWGVAPGMDGGPVADSDGRRRTQSMRASVKTLKKAAGFSFRKKSLKAADEAPGDVPALRGALRSEPQPGTLRRPRPLSAIEVFQQPCSPPSYEQAVQGTGPFAAPHRHPLTVQDAQREQVRRSPGRPVSMSDDFLLSCPLDRRTDCLPSPEEDQDKAAVRRRQRATSESAHRPRLEATGQPPFEEYSYAKESYV